MTDELWLLLHRAGFGPTAAELATARKAGYAAALNALLAPSSPDVGAAKAPIPSLGLDPFANKSRYTEDERAKGGEQRRVQTEQITGWWLDRMTVANHQAIEKFLFFWHGHWATSVLKVRSPQLMLRQHITLRNAPDLVAMMRQMIVDPALVLWLDGQLNTRQSPNENLAREMMELFTVGIGQYTEKDVKEAGRALTGWNTNLTTEKSTFDPRVHDAGSKTILGVTRNFTAETFTDLLLQHPATPRFLASRLWSRYASSITPIPKRTQEDMAAAFPSHIGMLRVLFQDDGFRSTGRTMVKQPVEWLVGAMRQLGVRLSQAPVDTVKGTLYNLSNIGQLPFAPPTVGGWPNGSVWLTSAAAQVRLEIASTLARLTQVDRLTPESMAQMLCLDTWSDRTHAVLRQVRDPQQLLTLGLASPEYLVT